MNRVLVTGGGGFLGRAIIDRLLDRGVAVRSISRGAYPDLAARGVETVRGDVADAEAVRSACRGCDTVFHTAAKAGIWGRPRDFYEANVRGTENVIAACLAEGVARLVHTSSPSVVFDGRDMQGVDESAPYPRRHHAEYPRTKAIAERLVLGANGDRLATVVLRPHLIWGPGDNHLVPRILARARSGRLRRVGSANNLIDSTYIDNAADAHLLAAERLEQRSRSGQWLVASGQSEASFSRDPTGERVEKRHAKRDASERSDAAPASSTKNPPLPPLGKGGRGVAGRAYFISNGEPMPLWDLVNGILAAGGEPPVTRSVPTWFARAAGRILETAYRAARVEREPPMTQFLAEELSTAHWFDISAARRDLGYAPRVTIADGLQRLGVWLRGCPIPSVLRRGGSRR